MRKIRFALASTTIAVLVFLGAALPTQGSSSLEQQVAGLVNQARANAGLPALRIDFTLTDVARARSKDMIVNDYFSHADGIVFKMLDERGYCFMSAGENIGWNNYPIELSGPAVHASFMESAGHRSNILNPDWNALGVGFYEGNDKKMWTEVFARRCGRTPIVKGVNPASGGGTKPAITMPPTDTE